MATSSVIGLKFFAFASKEVNLVNVNSKIKLFRRTCGARNKICSKHVKSHHLLSVLYGKLALASRMAQSGWSYPKTF